MPSSRSCCADQVSLENPEGTPVPDRGLLVAAEPDAVVTARSGTAGGAGAGAGMRDPLYGPLFVAGTVGRDWPVGPKRGADVAERGATG